ncbi:acyl-CoA carboxylase subunit beta [Anaeromyxobacter oryzisoli]|uniref:acyl-CoA carboxylase subunit beta n=1 Tax=Anaeromyxobacter oryzisoli TaxID=2925408 RepID=UPI001F572FE7|nr:acyl-CoA carboxylase subunit beta [Anaeromyxobacter sp. SG63]
MDADGTPDPAAEQPEESADQRIARELARIERGGAPRYHQKNAEQGKLFARERLRLLLDPGSFVEDGALANALDPELPADAVITGLGTVDGRAVCVMANDSTVKAGSWGARTVEKILRIQEVAADRKLPLLYLVDSAGARITDQVEMFPGRRGAGRIFHNEVHLSGLVPQICLLFGPSAAGGAYIPAFCDVVVMVEGNASMYLGSPRMAEMVIGEKVSLEELGGARMHCTVSGCGDFLVRSEEEALALARRWLSYLPQNHARLPPAAPARWPRAGARPIEEIVPPDQNKPFDMAELVEAIVDEGSFLEVKRLWAGELLTGLARIDGRVVGILANQPRVKGGVLFVDSADKAARFIWLCDAFNVPLLYLADVPGFMIGTKVERAGIIRAGAKMISAVSEATVPRICVVVRKAYGAGLYAMDGPGFGPSATLALPQAMIAVMGPEAAVNAVYFNKVQERPEGERAAYVAALREEYRRDIDLVKLASELAVDAVVPGARLRDELARRFRFYAENHEPPRRRKRGVPPV